MTKRGKACLWFSCLLLHCFCYLSNFSLLFPQKCTLARRCEYRLHPLLLSLFLPDVIRTIQSTWNVRVPMSIAHTSHSSLILPAHVQSHVAISAQVWIVPSSLLTCVLIPSNGIAWNVSPVVKVGEWPRKLSVRDRAAKTVERQLGICLRPLGCFRLKHRLLRLCRCTWEDLTPIRGFDKVTL